MSFPVHTARVGKIPPWPGPALLCRQRQPQPGRFSTGWGAHAPARVPTGALAGWLSTLEPHRAVPQTRLGRVPRANYFAPAGKTAARRSNPARGLRFVRGAALGFALILGLGLAPAQAGVDLAPRPVTVKLTRDGANLTLSWTAVSVITNSGVTPLYPPYTIQQSVDLVQWWDTPVRLPQQAGGPPLRSVSGSLPAWSAVFLRVRCEPASLTRVDLSGVDWHGVNLSGNNLSYSILDGAILNGANLTGADLSYASLEGTTANQAVFDGARLDYVTGAAASFTEASFDESSMVGAELTRCGFERARFDGVPMQNFDATESRFEEAEFSDSQMQAARFDRANLEDAEFSDSNLQDASFASAQMRSVDFEEVEAEEANFYGASLRDLLIRESDFDYADFRLADLDDAELERSSFRYCDFRGANLNSVASYFCDFYGAIFWGPP